MHKVVILADLGLVRTLFSSVGRQFNVTQVYDHFLKSLVGNDEELWRIFLYDADPYDGTQNSPISNTPIDFKSNPIYKTMTSFFSGIIHKDLVALRKGETKFRGWLLKDSALKKLTSNPPVPLSDNDFKPNIQQKGVDIKIGLDVAWISEHNSISKIILVTADSDFIPAMKFARRQGVQIALIKAFDGTGSKLKAVSDDLAPALLEHADYIRNIKYVGSTATSQWELFK
ncbi:MULTISPECIES: NYN domain-containing protein [Brevibacillus]|uniref:NYN domain-containing protein n=1 Tax=Brevibacillus TaxID=55080 RepID=UPI00203B7A47|nr:MULTISPECIES: NYN domain-containing protein [Brevibacillus]MCM3625262.1 NYN domain-containing protein [Brevibacillus borstelensis]MDH4620042.1 NYN domain-containing protein [Brevibacillus sp. AY1]